jgi:hypothetical protein
MQHDARQVRSHLPGQQLASLHHVLRDATPAGPSHPRVIHNQSMVVKGRPVHARSHIGAMLVCLQIERRSTVLQAYLLNFGSTEILAKYAEFGTGGMLMSSSLRVSAVKDTLAIAASL